MPVDNWEKDAERRKAKLEKLRQQWESGHEPVIHPLEGDVDLNVRDLLREERKNKPSERERL